MANRRKAATEPLQDDVVVKAERIEEGRAADSTPIEDVVQEKVISKEERIAELRLILDGLQYKRQQVIQSASKEIDAIQQRVKASMTELDAVSVRYADELRTLSGETKE